jgi:hypothetical protein
MWLYPKSLCMYNDLHTGITIVDYVMWLWLSNELCCIICIYIFYRKMYIQSSPLINEIGCEEKSFIFILNRLFIPNQQLFEYISDLVILKFCYIENRGSHGHDRMVVRLTTTYAINCEFESHTGGMHSIHHYVIKFVSDMRQVCGFLQVPRFPPPIKLTATI